MARRGLSYRSFWLLAPLAALLVLLGVLPALLPAGAALASEGRQARVRVIHAIPDAGAVDVYVNGARALAGVPFFTVSGYLSLAPGSYRVQVVAAGTRPGGGNTIIDGRLTFSAGIDYSVAARGTVASGDSAGIGASVIGDDNVPPAVVGQARVRAVHLAPTAPTVDIFVNGERTISGLSFREDSGYLTVPAGSYTIGVAPEGGEPIYTTEVTLGAGEVATAWANGLLGESGDRAFKVSATVDQTYSATARLRAVHAVPDLAGTPVDVYLNDVKAVTFDFFSVTDYLEVYEGLYQVRVVPAGGDPATQAAIRANIHLAPGEDYSAVARGTVAANDSAPLNISLREDDNEAPEAGEARVRVAHFSPDAPAVDILVNGNRVVTNLKYRQFSGYLSVPAGTYTVGVAPAGGEPIYTTELTVEAGQVATAWANGLLGGSGAQAFKVTPSIDREGEPAPVGEARVRVLHGSPDAPAVDVFLEGEKVVDGLVFGQATDYLAVPAGTYNAQIRVAGTETVVFEGPLTVEAEQAYTVAALGVVGGQEGVAPFQVVVFEDEL
jgi:hypothetical protein